MQNGQISKVLRTLFKKGKAQYLMQEIADQKGNIFFMLFGAVAVVGLLGTVTVSVMRGPLSTMVEVQSRTKAESEMAIASRLTLLEATEQSDDGDCDADGFVEPLEFRDAGGAGPTGGGFLPNAVASARIDPWGVEYGYCSWDAGAVVNALACDTDSSGTNERLDGNSSPTDETYTVVAIISAGPDQSFSTSCSGGGSPSITKGGDDIVVEYTYEVARGETGGLWNLQSGDPSIAEINKSLEVTGGATFTGNVDLSSSASAQLQLGAASLLLPDDSTLTSCPGASNINVDLIRINKSSSPTFLEICDTTGWVSVGGADIWQLGTGDDVYYDATTPQVGIGTTTPSYTLDVSGTGYFSGNLYSNSDLDISGNSALGNNVTIGGTLDVTGLTGLAGLGASGAVDFDSTLNVDGASTLSTLGASGAVDFDSTLNVDGATTLQSTIDAQGAISNSLGNVTISDSLDIDNDLQVSGALDVTGDTTLSGSSTVIEGNIVNGGSGPVTVDDSFEVIGGNAQFDDDVDISGGLNVGATIDVNGDQLGPALNCSSSQKLEWNNGSGWSCVTDLQGGSGGGAPALDDVTDVDAASPTDGDCIVYNSVSGDWEHGPCAGSGAGVFEIVSNVTRVKSSAGDYATDDFVFGSPQLDDDTDTTHDSRFFFDKDRAAFRAGSVAGVQWDHTTGVDENRGLYSTAFGYNPTASGSSSFAVGNAAQATATNTTAIGNNATASAANSTAVGYQNTASGSVSTALGFSSTAGGFGSITLGQYSSATGNRSMSMGYTVNNTGDYSVAWGLGDVAGAYPIVSGDNAFGIFMGDQSNYNLSIDQRFAIVGASDFLLDDDGTSGSQGCLRYDGSASRLEYSDDCSTWYSFSDDISGLWTEITASRIHFGTDETYQVGIGTSNPQTTLDVNGGVRVGTTSGGDAPTFMALNDLDDVTAGSPSTDECLVYDGSDWVNGSCSSTDGDALSDADGDTLIQLEEGADDDTIRFDTVGSERMVIDNTGNVGIGTDSPGGILEIEGNGDNPMIILDDIQGASTDNVAIYNDGVQFFLTNSTDGTGAFYLDIDGADIGSLGLGDFTSDTVESMLHLQSGVFRLDGGAGNEAGCIQYNDTSDELEFSDDCSTFQPIGAYAGGANEINDLDDGLTDYANNNLYLGQGTGGSNGVIANYELNMGIGVGAMANIGTGCDSAATWRCQYNVAFGYEALRDATTATSNIAIGHRALDNATTDVGNTAIGENVLGSLTGGQYHNTVVGARSATALASGGYNVMLGVDVAQSALTSGNRNTFIGEGTAGSLTTGNNNVFVGQDAGGTQTSGNSNILIGRNVQAANLTGSDQLNIGNLIYGDLANGDFIVGSYQLDDTTTGTEDNRMFFDSSKGAFRAGEVAGTQWDDGNVGTRSFAIGFGSVASGTNAFAGGYNSSATGNTAFAFGGNTTDATGDYSTAIGYGSDAAGGYSIALGRSVFASASSALAFGTDTIASGINSFALGLGSNGTVNPDATVSGTSSFGIFMGDQSGYDLTTANRMALVGGDFLIDDDGTAGAEGCIRFLEGTGLQFSHDCSTYSTMGAVASGAIAINDLSDAYTDYTTDNNMVLGHTGATFASGGYSNILIGETTGDAITTGNRNVAIGYNALTTEDEADENVAIGTSAMEDNDGGAQNTAVGDGSMANNTTGGNNTAVGDDSLDANLGGGGNTAIGAAALSANTNAFYSTALGYHAGQVSTGADNTFIGASAGESLATGGDNVFIGKNAASTQTAGDENIVIGENAQLSDLTGSYQLNIGNLIYGDLANGDFIVGSYQLDDTTTGTEDNRLFFDSSKGAFRAGTADTGQWDDANVGNYSVAMGRNVEASGADSFVFGANASATTQYAVAIGNQANATGGEAISIGRLSEASGNYSVTLGNEADASGNYSFAFGLGESSGARPTVSGTSSFGIFSGDQVGYDLTTANRMALVGADFLIDDDGSTPATAGCIRYNNGTSQLEYSDDCTTFSAFTGGGTGNGIWEVASNVTRVKSGAADYATDDFVFGSPQLDDDADADHQTRFFFDKSKGAFRAGYQSGTAWDDTNIGDQSIAMGANPMASGAQSIALGGWGISALADNAIAIGSDSAVTGANSTVIGHSSTVVGGTYSMALGREATVTGNHSMAIGLGNDANASGLGNPIVSGDNSFAIFVGDQDGVDLSDDNTLAIMGASGGVGIDTVSPNANLHVDGSDTNMIRATSGGAQRFLVDNTTGDTRLRLYTGAQSATVQLEAGNAGSPGTSYLSNSTLGIGTSTINSSALLQIDSTTRGFLQPRVTTTERDAIASPATGLQVYNTTTNTSDYYNGSAWVSLATTGGSLWTDNTTHITRENFHVLDAGATTDSAGLSDAGGGTGFSGIIYDTDSHALRGGILDNASTSWDNANIGDNSFAWGDNAQASGSESFAFGTWASASANDAIALGNSNYATNYASIAIGTSSTISGARSIGLGRDVNVTGSHSMGVGLGYDIDASGNGDPIVSGDYSYGIFMGDQDGYDLTTANRMALVGGDFLIDDDGTAGAEGCIRFLEGTGLQFSHDCSTYATMGTATATPAGSDREIQFNDGGTALGASTALSLSTNNRVLIGHNAELTPPGSTPSLQIATEDNTDGDFLMHVDHNDDGVGPDLVFERGQGNLTTPTAVADGVKIGSVRFVGHDGTNYLRRAQIVGEVDGSVSTNVVPISIIFKTTDSGNDDGEEAMRITPNHRVLIGENGTADGTLTLYRDGTGHPNFLMEAAAVTLPDYSTSNSLAGISGTNAFGYFDNNISSTGNVNEGGLLIMGLNDSAEPTVEPLSLVGMHSSNSPTVAAVRITAQKWDGTNNRAAIAANEIILDVEGARYDDGTTALRIMGDGDIGIGDFSADTIDSKLHIASGEIRIDGGADNEAGCIRYDDTDDELEYSDDCTTYVALNAVGGANEINDLSDAITDYTTDYNMFMGDSAGAAITTGGQYNIGLGQNTLTAAETGDDNIAIGYSAASGLTTESDVIAIGSYASADNPGLGTLSIGKQALRYATGDNNMGIGNYAGYEIGNGNNNIAVGSSAMRYTNGTQNVALGNGAGYGVDGVSAGVANSVFIGRNAGRVIETGDNNTFLGFQAGNSVTSGSDNILIGYDVDASSATASNELNIGGTLYGDLANDEIGLGDFSADTIDAQLHLQEGEIRIDGGADNEAGCIRYDDTDDELEYSDDCSTYVAFNAGGGGEWTDDGSGNIYNTDGGTVGIGITGTPVHNLSFSGDSAQYIGMETHSTPNTAGNDLNLLAGSPTAGSTNTNGGDLVLASGYATGDGYSTVAFYGAIANQGSGTTTRSPQILANIYGDASSGTYFEIDSTSTTADISTLLFQSTNGANINFGASAPGTNIMNIGSNGSLTVGGSVGASVDIFTIEGTSAQTGDYMNITTNGGTAGDVMTIDSSGNVGIGDFSATTVDAELHVLGDIYFTGVATDVSDRRLKTDIHPLSEKGALLERIQEIGGYSFRMKNDPNGDIEYGVMAQEIEKVFPELVITADDEMGTKAVNYLGLIAPMIEATKELAAENNALKAELQARDEKFAALEEKMDVRMSALEENMAGVMLHTGYVPTKASIGLLILLAMIGSLGLIWFTRRKGAQL